MFGKSVRWMAASTLGFVVIGFLPACTQSDFLGSIATPQEQAEAKSYVDRLRAMDFDAIERASDASIKGPTLRSTLEKMAAVVPAGDPRSVKLVGAFLNRNGSTRSLNITFEYEFPTQWIVTNVAILEKDGVKSIVGFNVYPRAQSIESENRFTFSGKSAIHCLFLAAAISAFLVSAFALVKCIRSRQLERKWLWILFILAGVGKFTVNWTSGAWGIAPLSLQLLSAGAVAPLYGAWLVSFSIPLGAIAFLIHARKAAEGRNSP